MDSSHVSLVSMLLRTDGFESLRCDKNINLGINMASMAKILKCAANDDVISLETREDTDALTLKFESPSKWVQYQIPRQLFVPAKKKERSGKNTVLARAKAPQLPTLRASFPAGSVWRALVCCV